ncbi:MAG TPA: hypothetical protein VGI81_05415 [Tepidisphaeraceae bacterium]|jgi:hypothetical protein
MEHDDPKPAIPYASASQPCIPAGIQIERFPDGGATFRVSGIRLGINVNFTQVLQGCVAGIFVVVTVAIALRKEHIGGPVVVPLACAGVGILAVVAIRQLRATMHEGWKGRPPVDVIGLSSRSVYVDVIVRQQRVVAESPREKLAGIEQIFPDGNPATFPLGLRLRIDGRPPIPFATTLQYKDMMDLLDALLETMRRTAPNGSPARDLESLKKEARKGPPLTWDLRLRQRYNEMGCLPGLLLFAGLPLGLFLVVRFADAVAICAFLGTNAYLAHGVRMCKGHNGVIMLTTGQPASAGMIALVFVLFLVLMPLWMFVTLVLMLGLDSVLKPIKARRVQKRYRRPPRT